MYQCVIQAITQAGPEPPEFAPLRPLQAPGLLGQTCRGSSSPAAQPSSGEGRAGRGLLKGTRPGGCETLGLSLLPP